MSEQHKMSWDPDTSEFVDDNGWVIREPTGVTTVRCS